MGGMMAKRTKTNRRGELEKIKSLIKKNKNLQTISFIWAESEYPMMMHRNMELSNIYVALGILTELFASTAPETEQILHAQIKTVYDNMYNNTGSIN